MTHPYFAQTKYLSLIFLSWIAIFTLTRVILLIVSLSDADVNLIVLMNIFSIGIIYDIAFLLYAITPLAIGIFLLPKSIWVSKLNPYMLLPLFVLSLFIMLFVAVSEWFFWDEFGVRFNFISVDYLVYSDEVLNNILESYPMPAIISGLVSLSLFIVYCLSTRIQKALVAPVRPASGSVLSLCMVFLLASASYFFINKDTFHKVGDNVYQREIASNGPYQFFAAFIHNELDYSAFYAQLPESESSTLLHKELYEPNTQFIGTTPFDIRRRVINSETPKDLNVILVVIESLSAKYLGSFGNERNLTPNIDRLREDSLFFKQAYATGTRTVRGLEAITLSMPPTPGRSIVKRIGHETGFASLGQQLGDQGYDSVFIYGGRGYFDNMNAFFSGNGYRIVDQNTVQEDSLVFSNAWGMSDEDIYTQAINIADQDHQNNKLFFLQLMTTSNHRPYTYPDNRIDIPSGSGRDGAVKYTDHAIGDFIEQAKEKPWFDKTVFIFIADHTAGSAGKEDLPVENYHIPFFIYAPNLVEAGDIERLTSQIDVAPTLMGLLNRNYTSSFFGKNILLDTDNFNRVLIGNHQHLGLFDGNDLSILSPQKVTRRHNDVLKNNINVMSDANDPLIKRTISYYQSASYGLKHDLFRTPLKP